MTEAGPLDLISEDEEDEEAAGAIKLPGVHRGVLVEGRKGGRRKEGRRMRERENLIN